jgi:hypothetical protein
MIDYQTIKEELKKKDIIYWYDKNGKLLLTGNSKSKTKEKIKKLKIEGLLYRLHITFHTGSKGWQGGPIAVNVALFEKYINNVKKKLEKENFYKNGSVWFPKKFLETNRWDDEYLDLIIYKLKNNSLKFKGGLVLFTKL